MSNDPISQVDSNYEIYNRELKAEAEKHHKGETALMVDGEIEEYFPTPTAAFVAGLERHGTGHFSIQPIAFDPIRIGAQTLATL